MSIRWYFIRWIRGIIMVVQGLIQTFTLGFYEPNLLLNFESYFLDISFNDKTNERPTRTRSNLCTK